MSVEEFDRKIRDAADHHHPAYHDDAWERMALILDRHMPVKEERRRRFIAFFLLLLLGTGTLVGLLISRLQSRGPGRPVAMQKVTYSSAGTVLRNAAPGDTAHLSSTLPGAVQQTVSPVILQFHHLEAGASGPQHVTDRLAADESEQLQQDYFLSPAEPLATNGDGGDLLQLTQLRAASPHPAVPRALLNDSTADRVSKRLAARGKMKDGWIMSLSAGPDLSAVGERFGSVRLAKGMGLGYSRGRWLVRAGVYAARKLYSARPEDYHFSTTPPSSLARIDANCQVLEVPVTIAWRVAAVGRGNLSVVAGASSYFMKKEKYGFLYKYPGGASYTRNYEVNGEHNHFLSAAILAADYARPVGGRLLLSAQPYVEMPLKGVGEGRIRLKSAGILFSIGMNLGK